jgi:hypothetical protein
MLFMGTGIGVMTFFHFVEDDLESQMPFPPFTDQIFELRSKDWKGNEVATHTRLFNPIYSRKRNLDVLATALKREARWRETKVGRLGLVLLSAQDVLLTCRQLASRGIYCYDV